MMEAADHGRLDDPALVGALRGSGLRGILLEGEVGPGSVVVGEVGAQHAAQVGLVEHHHVVEALAAEGADEAFGVGILPRDPGRPLFADPQGLHSAENTAP